MTLHFPHLSFSNFFSWSCMPSKKRLINIRTIPGIAKRLTSITMLLCSLIETGIFKIIISTCYIPSVSKSLLTVIGTLPKSCHPVSFCFPLFCQFYVMAVCPCQGTWRDNLLLRLCVKCPISDCSLWRRSLDNSCPPCRSRKSSGKTKNIFCHHRAQSSRGSTPHVRAGALPIAPGFAQ